ncbi:ribosome recycling factor [Candidatus Peregrinibacteria bacterium HGW-Peregrinibacteria-1]|jgi:ribosome recycling factor|nr:MAG: ribosome recycling factor [Candidatus Peregrinibacteria bacterium HGW-Peregrinibacteria-1]
MSVNDSILAAESDFSKAIVHLKDQFAKLQIGRANSGLVEDVLVEIYGGTQPLKAVANISIPEMRTIQIQPWDKSALGAIEKAISNMNVGLNPINDGNVVRINIPQLTEERRKELVKMVKKLAEDTKITVRNSRQNAHNAFKKLKADNAITEDDLKNADKKLQDKVDDANKKIDELAAVKESDVMTI